MDNTDERQKPLITNPYAIKIILLFIIQFFRYIKYSILFFVIIVSFIFLATILVNYQVTDIGFVDDKWFEPVANILLLPINGEYDQHDIMNSYIRVSFALFLFATFIKYLLKYVFKIHIYTPFAHSSLISMSIITLLYISSLISFFQAGTESLMVLILVYTVIWILALIVFTGVRFLDGLILILSRYDPKNPTKPLSFDVDLTHIS